MDKNIFDVDEEGEEECEEGEGPEYKGFLGLVQLELGE